MNRYIPFPSLPSFFVCLVMALIPGVQRGTAQNLYFPPVSPAAQWDTISPASLGWCTDKIAPLYELLLQENTKGFVVLKDGRIVIEKYFGTFTRDSLWYWASAGKTLTAFLVGLAQEEGFFSITDTSSEFLGTGWTICTPSQEEKITIRHQLTMTTGLDDGVPDNHCTIDTCLVYLASAGTRWAYHNAPYTLLERVLVNATGQPVNTYTQLKLKNPTGMTGFWLTLDYDNVFFSTARSMARFGLLMQNKGAWGANPVMHDTAYMRQMTNSSQSMNDSYGYLWWLNGQSSYMLPTVQNVFPGSWAPNAPADMYAGLGKNGQIVSISPSKGIVFVRMGNAPNLGSFEIPSQLCDHIWKMLNEVMCTAGAIAETDCEKSRLQIYPVPATESFTVELLHQHFDLAIFDLAGHPVFEKKSVNGKTVVDSKNFKAGLYLVRATTSGKIVFYQKLLLPGK